MVFPVRLSGLTETASPWARLPPLACHVPAAHTYPLTDRVVPAGQLIPLGAHLGQQVLQPRQLLLQQLVPLPHAG